MRRIVVFDLDDTLYPEEQYILSGFRAVADWLKVQHDIADFYSEAKSFFDTGSRGNVFDLVLQKLGHQPDKLFVNQLVRVYREHPPQLRLFEDADWAIKEFQARGPLALLSDGYLIAQKNKLVSLGIADSFQVIMFSDTLGREFWKPSPTPYQKIMEQIPGEPSEFVYVADNPNKDFVTPRRLGWETIHIDRPGGLYAQANVPPEYEANHVISSLFSLANL